MSFQETVIASAVTAALSGTFPWIFRNEHFTSGLIISLVCGAAWGTLVGFALSKFKLRGLWLLVGAPVALYWPAAIAALVLHGGPT